MVTYFHQHACQWVGIFQLMLSDYFLRDMEDMDVTVDLLEYYAHHQGVDKYRKFYLELAGAKIIKLNYLVFILH